MDPHVAALVRERDELRSRLERALERRRVAEARLAEGADPRLAAMMAEAHEDLRADQLDNERAVAEILRSAS